VTDLATALRHHRQHTLDIQSLLDSNTTVKLNSHVYLFPGRQDSLFVVVVLNGSQEIVGALSRTCPVAAC